MAVAAVLGVIIRASTGSDSERSAVRTDSTITISEPATTKAPGGEARPTSFVDYGLGNFGFHASSPDAADAAS